jgi:hypothetical protein
VRPAARAGQATRGRSHAHVRDRLDARPAVLVEGWVAIAAQRDTNIHGGGGAGGGRLGLWRRSARTRDRRLLLATMRAGVHS